MSRADTKTKVALITGGSRGIGRACGEALLREGWVVELSSLSPASVESALAELGAGHADRVHGEAVDVRDAQAVDDWVAGAMRRHGAVHCLVNNAGLGRFGSILELEDAVWQEVVRTNLDGAFYAMRAAARAMVDSAGGWIFNIASLAGKNPFAGGAAYNASKFGLVGLSEAAMLDLRPHGVRVTTILPGSVDTDFFRRSRGDQSWMIQPEDIARMVVDLMAMPPRSLPSWVEIRPTRPPRK